jgi:type IV pilus assembly protein PilC
MVKAGEESGNVSGALSIVSGQMEKSYALTKTVRSALIYPGIIITVMIVLAMLLLIFMVPTLTETFEGIGAKLPFSTRVLIYLSDFMVENTTLVLASLATIVVAGFLFIRSRIGPRLTDVILIHIPIIGEIVRGVEIVIAIDTTVDVMQNHLYKNALKRARTAVEKGEPISTVFVENANLFPLFVGEMMAVGEETGKVSDMLKNVAQYYELP